MALICAFEQIPYRDMADVGAAFGELVGQYALRLTLSDGHDSGVYSFDRLRRDEMQDPDAWLAARLGS